LSVVQELLKYETVKNNIATEDNEALRLSASNGHLDVVEILVEHYPVASNTAIDVDSVILQKLIIRESARRMYKIELIADVEKSFTRELMRNTFEVSCGTLCERFFNNASAIAEDVDKAFFDPKHKLYSECMLELNNIAANYFDKYKKALFLEIVAHIPQLGDLDKKNLYQNDFLPAFNAYFKSGNLSEKRVKLASKDQRANMYSVAAKEATVQDRTLTQKNFANIFKCSVSD
jgi:hypothetical protein